MAIFLLFLGIPQKREYDFFAERDHEKERAVFISKIRNFKKSNIGLRDYVQKVVFFHLSPVLSKNIEK